MDSVLSAHDPKTPQTPRMFAKRIDSIKYKRNMVFLINNRKGGIGIANTP
jgi:hypothetical protein